MSIYIRDARVDDAKILVGAEKETAETPGLLVSRPHELTLESFETKISALAQIGRYVIAEQNGRVVGHALLEPMPLEATAHVFRLTIVVHTGFQRQGIGEALMRHQMQWAMQTTHVGKIELLPTARSVCIGNWGLSKRGDSGSECSCRTGPVWMI